jgi:hypothetical protein
MVSTRTRVYDDAEPTPPTSSNQPNIPPTPPTPQQETLLDRRRRWASLLHTHDYRTLITEVLDQELPKYSPNSSILPTSLSSIMAECVLILASAPLIFTAAVDGSLPARYLVDADLQAEYAEVQRRANIQPSIYIHLLATHDGVAPSANQYMAIRSTILRYIDTEHPDHTLASHIDNVSRPTFPLTSTTRGLRKYLTTPSAPRSPIRTQTLLRFCAGVLDRWTATPEA